jgi:hypothetical protein
VRENVVPPLEDGSKFDIGRSESSNGCARAELYGRRMSRLVELTGQTLNADNGDHRMIAQYFAQFPSSRWLGSPHVLRTLGIYSGAKVKESAVLDVLGRSSATSTGKELIQSQNSTRDGGDPSAHTHVHAVLRAPDDVQKSFSPERRRSRRGSSARCSAPPTEYLRP